MQYCFILIYFELNILLWNLKKGLPSIKLSFKMNIILFTVCT